MTLLDHAEIQRANAVVEALFTAQRVSKLPKIETEAWTQDQNVYWDGSNKKCTSDGIGPLIGVAAAPAANHSTFGYVALAAVVPRTTLADITTPNATDAASAVTLANATKAKLNALLAALRNGAAS